MLILFFLSFRFLRLCSLQFPASLLWEGRSPPCLLIIDRAPPGWRGTCCGEQGDSHPISGRHRLSPGAGLRRDSVASVWPFCVGWEPKTLSPMCFLLSWDFIQIHLLPCSEIMELSHVDSLLGFTEKKKGEMGLCHTAWIRRVRGILWEHDDLGEKTGRPPRDRKAWASHGWGPSQSSFPPQNPTKGLGGATRDYAEGLWRP